MFKQFCTCIIRSCESGGGTPTPAGISIFTLWKICTHKKCEVKHNGDTGIGHLSLNGWGIYGLDGWDSYDKAAVSFGNMLKNCWCSGDLEFSFRWSHDHRFRCLWTPSLWPTTQRGRDHSSSKACFNLRSPALGWLSQYYEYTVQTLAVSRHVLVGRLWGLGVCFSYKRHT